jgi:hypothetical protein
MSKRSQSESCQTCKHWGAHKPAAPAGRVAGSGQGARYCGKPRVVKETLEARRSTDWCTSYALDPHAMAAKAEVEKAELCMGVFKSRRVSA